MANQTTKIAKPGPSSPSLLYTLQFKNGRILKHRDPLALSQFRSDGRLATVLRETSSERTEGLLGQDDFSS